MTINRNYLILPLLFVLLLVALHAQGQVVMRGTVRDAGTGEALVGAHVSMRRTGQSVATNNYGFYSLRLKPGADSVLVSLVGYVSVAVAVEAQRDTVLNLELRPHVDIAQVVVEGSADGSPSRSAQIGSIRIPMKGVERMPVLLGERDVFRTVQLQPGVHAGVEGSSGIYVRGGRSGSESRDTG